MKNKLCIAAERVTGPDEFERSLEIAKERNLGIEVQEFYLTELRQGDWQDRLNRYIDLLQDFQEDLSIHNAFLWIDHLGLDPEIAELTKRRYDFVFMIAKELGCKVIVSHFEWHPFFGGDWLKRWQEGSVRFWEKYVNIAEREGFVLVGENTSEPRPEVIKPIIDKLNSDRFKFVLDVGHANLFSEVPLEEWLTTFGSDLVYLHAHNNYRDYDAHNPVFRGTVNFDHLFHTLDKLDIAPTITTEIYGDGLLESLDFLAEKIRASRAYRKNL